MKTVENPFINNTPADSDEFSVVKHEFPYSINIKIREKTKTAKQDKEKENSDSSEEIFGLDPRSDEEIDDGKALNEWLTKNEIEKEDLFSFCCEHCTAMFHQEEEIVNHVKEQHPDKAEFIPQVQSGGTKKVNFGYFFYNSFIYDTQGIAAKMVFWITLTLLK